MGSYFAVPQLEAEKQCQQWLKICVSACLLLLLVYEGLPHAPFYFILQKNNQGRRHYNTLCSQFHILYVADCSALYFIFLPFLLGFLLAMSAPAS